MLIDGDQSNMNSRREMREIHAKRRMRKRKKIFFRVGLVVVVLFFVVGSIALCHKTKKNNMSDEPNSVNVTDLTPAPSATEKETTVDPTPSSTQEPTQETTPSPTDQPIERRGVSQAIPEDVKKLMLGHSMPQNATVKFENLAYLTIPHYDFNYNVVKGHMVVNANLADEVLDIFAELYDIKYPIERMELVDNYNADDFLSIEYNNTSAFNYRESTDGSGRLSKHALGRAIDINPQINPYVNSNGVGAHQNAKEYWSRDISSWTSDIAKAAYIGKNTEIYNIFVNKYGWEWGGSWSSYRDYQHFQKIK